MTDDRKKVLKELQVALMKRYTEIETNPENYENFQGLLDDLDMRMEFIRGILEGRWGIEK